MLSVMKIFLFSVHLMEAYESYTIKQIKKRPISIVQYQIYFVVNAFEIQSFQLHHERKKYCSALDKVISNQIKPYKENHQKKYSGPII